MVRRLNWGCGPICPLGWVNSDVAPFPGVDVVGDVRSGLPFADNAFDYIVAIHALPEIPYADMDRTLTELHRVLKPGGVLRLSLPDMDRAIQAYLANDLDYFLIDDQTVRSCAGKMIVQLTWFGQSRCMFTFDFTRELLERNRFEHITRCAYQQSPSALPGILELDDRPLESLFVEARKAE